jgi:hypothetical protein
MWVLTAPARYILRALSCDHHDKRKWKLLSFLKKDSCCMQMHSNAQHLLMIHLFDLQPNNASLGASQHHDSVFLLLLEIILFASKLLTFHTNSWGAVSFWLLT